MMYDPYEKFHECTRCNRSYHHQMMMQKKYTSDHLCIRCFNIRKKENEKSNTLQSNDYSKNTKVA